MHAGPGPAHGGAGGEERFEVETNASGYLVVRDSYARGWRARVDGVPAPVLRANGKHRAVAIPAGKHQVVLRYGAPGLGAGVAVSLVSLAAAALLWTTAGAGPKGDRCPPPRLPSLPRRDPRGAGGRGL